MTHRILLLPGDGIGPEIVAEAQKLLSVLPMAMSVESALLGGVAVDVTGQPLPDETLEKAKAADCVILGAVGGPKWDGLANAQRPEKGLLGLRAGMGLFANLRPAKLYKELEAASSLKPEVVSGLDILIVRELTGGLYFGQPRGIRPATDPVREGEREGFNTYVYCEHEIERIGRVAFEMASQRQGRLCSIDKANVLEVTQLWREVMTRLAPEYPNVTLSHMYVDNAAMQLVRAPKQFDVLVTGNLFGDILSDQAAMLTGSIGMLPSASLNASQHGLFEPCHGSAPDIAGRGMANPLATLLSVALACRYSLDEPTIADRIERAIQRVLASGLRTVDIAQAGQASVSTEAMGDAVVKAFLAD
ncbi:MAG: 3-isopropylmalate dehydrogenase [Gammaproteobacteria bacterium]